MDQLLGSTPAVLDGEDSYLSLIDWVNPLEIIAMGGDAGRWLDRQINAELIGVTMTISGKDGSPLRSYSFGTDGIIQSVGTWKNGNLSELIHGPRYLRELEEGKLKDNILESLINR